MSGAVALLALGRLVWCAIATARTLRRVLRAAPRADVLHGAP
ncbi:hypothetical protein [Streptomyces sp. NPDC093105]